MFGGQKRALEGVARPTLVKGENAQNAARDARMSQEGVGS